MPVNVRRVQKKGESARVSQRWLRDILAALYRIRPATRADVALHARLNNASVSRGLQKLVRTGLICKIGERESGGVRPGERG